MRGGRCSMSCEGCVAEFDGADDALLVELAGLFEGDVSGDVYGGELLAYEEHAGFGGVGELGDVLGVAGEGAAGEGYGFLVEGCGDHGVGFAGEAHLGGAADVVDGGQAVFGAEFAELEGGFGVEIVGLDDLCGEGGGVDAGGAGGGFEGRGVGDEEPVCDVGEGGVGEGFEGDLGAYSAGVSDGDCYAGFGVLCGGHEWCSLMNATASVRDVSVPKPPDFVMTVQLWARPDCRVPQGMPGANSPWRMMASASRASSTRAAVSPPVRMRAVGLGERRCQRVRIRAVSSSAQVIWRTLWACRLWDRRLGR